MHKRVENPFIPICARRAYQKKGFSLYRTIYIYVKNINQSRWTLPKLLSKILSFGKFHNLTNESITPDLSYQCMYIRLNRCVTK